MSSTSALAGMQGLGTQNLNTQQGVDDNQVKIQTQQAVNNASIMGYGSGMEKTQAEIMSMSDSDFNSYLKQAQIINLDGFLPNVDTQRAIFAMGLNSTPNIVDTSTFNKLKGTTLYRTVNYANDGKTKVSAPQILDQMAKSSVNRIGSGIYGDGHYFSSSQSGSNSYGNTRGNLKATAQVRMKLNANAKVIDYNTLDRMYQRDKSASTMTIKRMTKVGGYSGDNAITIYALRKGFNVIKNNTYFNVIDRSAMTLENVYSPI